MGIAIAAVSVVVLWCVLAAYFEYKNRQADKKYLGKPLDEVEKE